jgi:sodium-dependent dicarboxylate transporter 2/3/5
MELPSQSHFATSTAKDHPFSCTLRLILAILSHLHHIHLISAMQRDPMETKDHSSGHFPAAEEGDLPPPLKEVLTPAEERLETWRRTGSLFLGPLVFGLLLIFPPESLSATQASLAAILAWVLIWWIGEAVPLPVTALLGPALAILLAVAPAREALAGFADPIVFVFIGSFMLARAMTVHGLDRRLALGMLALPGMAGSPARLVVGFGAVAAIVSMGISNTAVTAMMVPIGLGLLGEVERLARQSGDDESARQIPRVTVALLLITAYGASVGGIATPIGTPPNLIGIGQLREALQIPLSFTDWMAFALPMTFVMFIGLAGVILWLERPGTKALPGLKTLLASRRARLGPLTPGERNALIAFLVAFACWTAPAILGIIAGHDAPATRELARRLPEAVGAVLAAIVLFILPLDWPRRQFTLTWEQATRIDWGTILIFGSGICLGSLAFSTGLARTMADGLLAFSGVTSLLGLTALATGMAILLSELTSNTAAATMIVPVSIAMAQSAGVDPVPPAIGACIGASFGFILPVSTAPNALIYGTGRVPLSRMFRAGIIFDVLGWIILSLMIVWLTAR